MMSSGGDNTDDQGTFRIYGLAPGDYLISATIRSQAAMMSMPGMTSAETEGYAPGYYPGTPNMAEAQRVVVKGGQELTGINFALAATRLARVRGRVTTAAGEPAVAMMVMVSSADQSTIGPMMFNSAQTRGDGTFQIVGLAPGSYTMTARSMLNPMASELGQVRVTVDSEDLDNLLDHHLTWLRRTWCGQNRRRVAVAGARATDTDLRRAERSNTGTHEWWPAPDRQRGRVVRNDRPLQPPVHAPLAR